MKSFELKEYQEGAIKTKTQDIISQVIDYSGNGSITTSEQRKRIKLLDLLEPQYESKNVSLEDEDYRYLQQLIDEMKWGVSNKTLRSFLKDFS